MLSISTHFDNLLGGGLSEGVITMVYGAPGSGKSNFAMMAAVSASREGQVIYIDTEGGLSPQRIEQISGGKGEELLENFIVARPTSFEEQVVAIKSLESRILNKDVRLIVLDNLSILHSLLEERNYQDLERQLAGILRVARIHHIPALVTNQCYEAQETKELIPIGANAVRRWCKVMVELGMKENVRYAILRKHHCMPVGKVLVYKISDKGIKAIKLTSLSEIGTKLIQELH